MRNIWILTAIRMRLAMRNRAFIFFSLVMPLAFLFVFASIFGRSMPQQVKYLLPSVLALTVMGSFWGLSIQLVLFREQGILRRFHLAPVGPFAMLASSIITNYVLTIPTIVIELFLVRTVWHVESFGNLLGLVVMISLGVLTFASFGLIVASVTNTMQETQVINNLIWFAFLFFSGATFPIAMFPAWLHRASVFLPATHLIIGLQLVVLGGLPIWKAGPEVVALVTGLVMSLFVSTKLFRWEPEERIDRRAKLIAAAVVIPFLLVGVWENAQSERRRALQSFFGSAQQRESAPPSPSQAPAPQQQPPSAPPR
ncbi:MAG: ABC transporter permease [Acidobacteria bacterium]|nr:ABC transporter permease [Acidobacteriota bacterium]MCL5288971.1 ABC transporter permease [Acidobacteriota bacterium]